MYKKLIQYHIVGRGNSTVVSVSVCEAGRPCLRSAQSACLRKLKFYQGAINLFPPVLTTSSTKAVHMLSCLCDNACKRSLAICRTSRASCPISRLLSVPILFHQRGHCLACSYYLQLCVIVKKTNIDFSCKYDIVGNHIINKE